MSTYHTTDQGQTGTCYAHAAARMMLHAWRRVECATAPSMATMIKIITQKYGTDGANTVKVIDYFGDPAARHKELQLFKSQCLVDPSGVSVEGDLYDYFLLPKLRCTPIATIDQLHASGRYALCRFYLDGPLWTAFSRFYKNNPTDILKATDLVASPGVAGTAGGHAVVVDIAQSIPGKVCIKNSWGAGWGDNGRFYVESMEVLNGELFDVTWLASDIDPALTQRKQRHDSVLLQDKMPRVTGTIIIDSDHVIAGGGGVVFLNSSLDGEPCVVKRITSSSSSTSPYSPLCFAIFGNYEGSAKLLVEHGASLNTFNSSGMTPLMYASRMASSHQAPRCSLGQTSRNRRTDEVTGRTALFYAVLHNQAACLRILIDRGCDLDARDSNGDLATDIAHKLGHEECVQMLEECMPERATARCRCLVA